MKQDEKPMAADDISLAVNEKNHDEIRKMLRRHETMWTEELVEKGISEHHIHLILDSKPFKSLQFRTGPNLSEVEAYDRNKRLIARVIEPTILEWAAPVFLAPWKECKLRFCIDYCTFNTVTVKHTVVAKMFGSVKIFRFHVGRRTLLLIFTYLY